MSGASIFLCGFMGVGKSTVGKVLADTLELPFHDTDQLVIKTSGRSIRQIFSEEGETRFREFEAEAIARVAMQGPSVVALGGGALNHQDSLKIVRSKGRLIYLVASLNTLVERLHSSTESRPLLAGLEQGEKALRIATMLKAREAVYKTADMQVETDGRDPKVIADEILSLLKRSLS